MLTLRPRKPITPLDLTVRVATRLPLGHRMGFPCFCCGSAVEPGQVYCPRCAAEIQQRLFFDAVAEVHYSFCRHSVFARSMVDFLYRHRAA
jgi:predicted amidophosphoribosyltransferase